MIDILYKEIRAQLKTQVTAVKWIDLESGQLDNPEQNYPFPFPAVFVDIETIDWQDAGERMQDGLVTVSIRAAFRIYEQTHSQVEVNEYDAFTKAMTALQLINTIHSKLQGFAYTSFNRLSRVRTDTEKRTDGLKVFSMRYTCQARDKAAMKTYNLVPDGAALNVRQGINLSHLVMGLSVDDSTPEIGSTVNFSFTVENIGSESATGAEVSIILGDGLKNTNPDFDGIWSVGSVAVDESKTLVITAQVQASGTYTAAASLTYTEQADPPSHATAAATLVPVVPEGD